MSALLAQLKSGSSNNRRRRVGSVGLMKAFLLMSVVRIVLVLAGIAVFSESALAQLPQTRVQAIFPLGGQAGSTCEVTVTVGVDLENLTGLRFDHPGIVAVPKSAGTADPSEVVPNVFVVTIGSDVPLGIYDVRAVGLYGESNPKSFHVGKLPELFETEPSGNNKFEGAQLLPVPCVVNGRCTPLADLDFFKLQLGQGERVLIRTLCKLLDTRLDASLELYDSNRKKLKFARMTVQREPLIDFTAPADGEYFIRICDFIYEGTEEHGYRLTIDRQPHIDFVLPAAGVPGTTQTFQVYGRLLPGGVPSGFKVDGVPVDVATLSLPVPALSQFVVRGKAADSQAAAGQNWPLVVTNDSGSSLPFAMGFAAVVPSIEVEPNNAPSAAQVITLPADVTGQFAKRGDVDVFRFSAKAGEIYWISALGQRLGSAADPYIVVEQVVVNEQGEQPAKRLLAADDDPQNPLSFEFETTSKDPSVRFVAPADGDYRVTVRDRASGLADNPATFYRLLIEPEKPDFVAIAAVSAPNAPNVRNSTIWGLSLRRGGSASCDIAIIRQHGYTGRIKVSAEGLPAGVTCREIELGPQASLGTLVFRAAADAAMGSGSIRIVATGVTDSPAAVAEVTAAWQAWNGAIKQQMANAPQLVEARQKLAQLEATYNEQKAQASAQPENADLAAAAAATEQQVAAAAQNVMTVEAAGQAAMGQVPATMAALQGVIDKRTASQTVTRHAARYGAVMFNAVGPNQPSKGRQTDQLVLSVLSEAAPFHIEVEPLRVIAGHNSQVLVPVQAVRQPGFEAAIPLTLVGVPPNLGVENKTIAAGQTLEVLKLTVTGNVQPGIYPLRIGTVAQAPFRRWPERLDKAQALLAVRQAEVTTATEQVTNATRIRDELVAKVNAANEALRLAGEAKTAAEELLKTKQAAVEAANGAIAAAGENAEALAQAQEQLKLATAEVATVTQQVTAAETARVEKEAEAKKADEERNQAQTALTAAEAGLKTANDQKTAAEQKVKAAEEATKVQNLNSIESTSPIILEVRPFTVTCAAAPANNGEWKLGEELEIKVDITRHNGYEGPVKVELINSPLIKGISAEPVMAGVGLNTVQLKVKAAADATEGAVTYAAVRVSGELEGQASSDAAINIKTVKP
jgi:hypothetical protein